MKLTPEQRRIARTIDKEIRREGKRRGAPKKIVRRVRYAGQETAAVEANWGNPAGGHGSSVGWRQETASSYPNVNRRDVKGAAQRFAREAFGKAGQYNNAGRLAQAVQRSAYPGRYNQRKGDAKDVLRQIGGKVSGGSKPSARTKTIPGVDRSEERRQLLASYVLNQRPTRVNVTDPLKMLQQGSSDDLLSTVQQLRQIKDTPSRTVKVKEREKTRVKRPDRSGGPNLSPRGGWAGTEGPARRLAQIGTGLGLKVVSKKRGTVSTASGGVSDHYRGNTRAMAYDLSNGSSPTPQMDEAAYRIAKAIGIKGYKKGTGIAKSVVKNGIRYQLIYRSNVGGNHFDHVHLGAKRL